MPLSDLFKKSPKKEPAKASQPGPAKSPKADESLFAPEMQKKRYDAAMEFLKNFQERMPLVGGKPHAGTVLAVPARLAGSSLYRSLNYKKDITPGVVVLSNEVNEAWPQLMNLFAFYCKQDNVDITSKPPATKFPEQDRPRMEVEEVLAEYQDQYHEIMQRHGLDYLNGARAGMIVCAMVFRHACTVAKDIESDVAAGIVAMGIVEGAKTAPPPLKSGKTTKHAFTNNQNQQVAGLLKSIAENSTNGSGTRLVLGEGMTAMQEASSHGGKYILVHPMVLSQLQGNNIDPFFVYEAAIRLEIESKIPRIDFVGANVDHFSQEWSGRPEVQIPIHIRSLLWLKNNAKTYGYEQHGNSWVFEG